MRTHTPPPQHPYAHPYTLTYACFSQIAYFALLDISLLLPVSRDETDEAMRIFHKYGTVIAFFSLFECCIQTTQKLCEQLIHMYISTESDEVMRVFHKYGNVVAFF